ncbi:hypothetical protein AU184_15965 [Mycolicibacterium novocastrense]|uniref:hypothetical protein n=1 Tax=Mycolicibacterium novocastrense TaxID=59813 RepID=UPI00074A3517|nr:hypothetical protein [Mycolicibacterium novocastrense]KUH71518.1 hypothetical protein AU072_00270 [Mycolicibacterium novocastrense]KUH71931.1 hypothetical protein AU183_12455 [Mycolicibacterium novocastrense]KUH79897.1 hypothetical protein AU184_15965 [Mycolicibacterium novocastrense]
MRAVMVVAGLAAAAALAGCASEQPAEQQPTTSQAPAQTTTSQAPAETTTSETPSGHGSLAQCLDEHGVPAAPGPAAGPPPGVDAETWNRAMQACATFAPGPAG